MLKFVRLAVQRTYKIRIINHGEQETMRDGTQDYFGYRQRFLSGRECDRLEFYPRQFTAREIPLVQCRIVSQY